MNSNVERTPKDLARNADCWIEPSGRAYFLWGSHSHCTMAREELNDESGGLLLEREGWLHVSYSTVYPGYKENDALHPIPPTQAQLDTLFDIASAILDVNPNSFAGKNFLHFIERNAPKEYA